MSGVALGPLRVLIANEERERLDELVRTVAALGHDAVVHESAATDGAAAASERSADVAIVGVGASSARALELIGQLFRSGSCPVIALLNANDPSYVHEAAKRGAFAYVVGVGPDELQSAIEITLQRFAEYRNLQGAFGRRAAIEQAKGILMERYRVDGDAAFELLRRHSQRFGRKLSDVAVSVVECHLLLPSRSQAPARARPAVADDRRGQPA